MRERILHFARQLFIESGYAGVSMREIAQAVGVSKPALYYHFRDKETLFLAIVLEFIQELNTKLLHVSGQTTIQKMAAVVRLLMNLPMEERALICLLIQESHQLPDETRASVWLKYQTEFLDPIQAVYDHGVQNGEFRRLSGHVVVWTLLGMVYPYTFSGQNNAHTKEMEEEAGDQLLDIFLHGVKA